MNQIAVPPGAEQFARAHKFRPMPDAPSPPRAVTFKAVANFCDEYSALSYCIEPIVRSSSIYSVTAKTGGGKTGFFVAAGLAVASNRPNAIGLDIAEGRVAYLAFENPDDVRMRIMATAYKLNINVRELKERFVICDMRAKPEEVIAKLDLMAKTDGPFALVLADTYAAFFDGTDLNDNVQTGAFMRRLRPVTQIPGRPACLVACHPVKNASDDQLVPYGGGAALNELDGNLTLRPDGKLVSLHWQGKLRGLEFTPKVFRFELVSSPDLLDAKGRSVQLPVLRPLTAQDAEAARKEDVALVIGLLRVVSSKPAGTQRQWADILETSPSTINRAFKKLVSDKLIEGDITGWRLTAKGERAAKNLPPVSQAKDETT